MMKHPAFLVAVALLAMGACARAETTPLAKLDAGALEKRIRGDERAVRIYRDGLARAMKFVDSRPDLFPKKKLATLRNLTREEKEAVWNTWKAILDYTLALDSVGRYHEKFYRIKDDRLQSESFLTSHAAFLASFRCALDFIARVENDSGLDKVLNDPVPEIGLPEGTYDRYKFRFLNVARAAEFGAMDVTYKAIARDRPSILQSGILQDSKVIWKAAKGRGEVLTAKNALQIIKDTGLTAWFPVQAGVSEWMGDVKVRRRGQSLISPEQIQAALEKLQPGDILLERREWFLSNIGLPGYWPHAALFIGTPEERSKYFNDTEVQSWVRSQGVASGDFEELLRTKWADAYRTGNRAQEHGHSPRVLEAMSEGVSFTTLEHSADADALAVLRPRVSKTEKAMAIARAFHYSGRPYDFDFDFATDSELVCTELVFKSYEPSKNARGLKFPLVEMLGRLVTPANEMARQFDEQCGSSSQQSDLILFLDGYERTKNAVFASMEHFRQSWKRPKWHIVQQRYKTND